MQSRKHVHLSIILPAYNEAENLALLVPRLATLAQSYEDYEILVVDDGSTDNTSNLLQGMQRVNPKVRYLSLSRNFGHQSALRAGLDHAQGNCVLSMDADFQHPPELISEMVHKWQEGFDIVTTLRQNDPDLPRFKGFTSRIYSALLNKLSDINLETGAADFRLLDRTVVEVFKALNEPQLFLRGMVNWVGFQKCSIAYKPAKRVHGSTKYTLNKMMALALQGIMSFSAKPLRIAIYMGFTVSLAAMCYGLYAMSVHFFTDRTVPGWTSVIISVLFCGGMQMLLLGIIGEYLGRLFMESKRRPDYIVRKKRLGAGDSAS